MKRKRRAGRHEERIAVGGRFGYEIGADQSPRARAVLDHHRLLECGGKTLADHARKHVRERTGRIRHDEAQRTVRIARRGILRECAARKQHERQKTEYSFHVSSVDLLRGLNAPRRAPRLVRSAVKINFRSLRFAKARPPGWTFPA